MQQDSIIIASIARTPLGNFQGGLAPLSATELGSHVIKAVIERAKIKPEIVHEVIMGCVLPAGLGQAPARQASLAAGIPQATPCTTINKVCGSGMKAVMFAEALISTGASDVVIAGGMESMTNAPYLLKKARGGYRLGHDQIFDHMMMDGLEDAYDKGCSMGVFAEQCVEKYNFTREEQDDYASSSFKRAVAATENNAFKDEIAPITVKTRKSETIIDKDEHPFSVNPEKIPSLRAVFKKDGTVTAGNASCISDGAAALLLMRESKATELGVKPLAKILAHATHAQAPAEFTTAPVHATKKLMDELNWKVEDVDLFEVNEAFAVVTLAIMKELNIPHSKMNVNGGAVALGHPIGATGARIVVTLVNALRKNNLKRGIASLCIGGGEATAVAIEIL